MAVLDLEALTAPIEDENPCGPDLELEEDDDFFAFVATSEMVLPDRYFVEDHEGNRKPFFTDDRFKDLDLVGNVVVASKLLTRTKDLRLLCMTAKFSIFDRKLDDFAVAVEAVAVVLERFWEALHPGAEAGLRTSELERLNEQYTVVTALNNAPLLRSKRFGTLSRQSYLAAVRENGGQDDVNTLAVDRILIAECRGDMGPIAAVQATCAGLARSLSRIRAICLEKLPSNPPDLGRVSEAVAKIRATLDRINPPAIEETSETVAADGSTAVALQTADAEGVFSSSRAARRALADATAYLTMSEPSSPALLLLRQAQALVGKSFLEALESLLPDQVRRARLSVAALPVFELPLLQIAERGVSRDDAASSDDDDMADENRLPDITSRGEALLVLDRVARHYRSVEPSSPIPLLIERARGLVGKDFVTLITSMLPDSVLRGE